jgi:predicted transcriptional regulator
MPTLSSPISLRLPKAAREKLDKATAQTRRSRSFLMQEALERHLDEIVREEAQPATERRWRTFLSLGGAGVTETGPRSPEEINEYIRWLRDNG